MHVSVHADEGGRLLEAARGIVVDHDALRDHLLSGHLAGAAVDVFAEEPKAAGAPFVSSLQGLPNVHLLGRKPYESLHTYCKGFDLGLIPFVKNELTMNVNPIKLREYLSAGLPVVSTDIPEVARYVSQTGPLARAESDLMLRKMIEHWDDHGFGLWIAELRETGELLGFVGLAHPGSLPAMAAEVEVGWRLARAHWGQGLATEGGAEAVVNALLEVVGAGLLPVPVGGVCDQHLGRRVR